MRELGSEGVSDTHAHDAPSPHQFDGDQFDGGVCHVQVQDAQRSLSQSRTVQGRIVLGIRDGW